MFWFCFCFCHCHFTDIINGWDWIADDLRGSNDVGGGRGGCKNCDWNELNEGGGGGGGCGGGIELLNGGGDGGDYCYSCFY